MEARINLLQQTMLHWNDVMPFNAIHVARLAGPLELEKLRTAVNRVLDLRQLTDLTIDRGRNRFHYGDVSRPIEIHISPLQQDARDALNQRTETELNTPFDCVEGFNPFRLFVIQDTGAFFVGLIYFHAIADGEAVIRLFQEIIDLYLYDRPPSQASGHPAATCGLWRHFPKNPAWLAKWLCALPKHVGEIRKFAKTPLRQGQAPRTVFRLWDLDPSALPALLRYAHVLGVTVNDVFLAALMKALSPYAQGRLHAEHGCKLAIAFIINIRRDLVGLRDNAFGNFLGTYHVTHPLPETMQLDQLVRRINLQTGKIRKKRLYALNLFGQFFAVRVMPRLDHAQRHAFYAEHYPLWGGMTNIDLSWYWKDFPRDNFYYFRAASIAPAAPLNLVITTVNQKINLAVSSNPCIYKTTDVEKIVSSYLNILASLPQS